METYSGAFLATLIFIRVAALMAFFQDCYGQDIAYILSFTEYLPEFNFRIIAALLYFENNNYLRGI